MDAFEGAGDINEINLSITFTIKLRIIKGTYINSLSRGKSLHVLLGTNL